MNLLQPNKNTKLSFFCLTIISGIIILYPYTHFNLLISQGDHGHNLYSFYQTSLGKLPFKDYWYPYGPLMPFYYAIFLNIFGASIKAVLLGKTLCIGMAGLFVFLGLSLFISPLLSFIASLWYWTFCPDFFYNFNHTGAYTFNMALLYFLFSYIKTGRRQFIYCGYVCNLFTFLVKINFGLFSLFAFMASLLLIYYRKNTLKNISFYAFPLLAIPLSVALLCWPLMAGLPQYAVSQCFSYFNAYFYQVSILYTLQRLFIYFFEMAVSSWPNFIFTSLVFISSVSLCHSLVVNRFEKGVKNNLLLILATLALFTILNLHEFFGDSREFMFLYKLNMMVPFQIILSFVLIHYGLYFLNDKLKLATYFITFMILFRTIDAGHRMISYVESSGHYLSLRRGQIHATNEREWFSTVERTVSYLESHLNEDELFFALPYEPLYYFLVGRPSPTWQVMTIEATGIPPAQEAEIIRDLDSKNVNYIVLSNRSYSLEDGVGILGQTYLPGLYGYILKNFEEVASYGNWDAVAGWNVGHAVKILKRKTVSPVVLPSDASSQNTIQRGEHAAHR